MSVPHRWVVKDTNNNVIIITARSKTQARNQFKNMLPDSKITEIEDRGVAEQKIQLYDENGKKPEFKPVRTQKDTHKTLPNALCPCGSGKKYKKCCQRKR